MPKLSLTRDARQRLKEIRPYVNFNYDLRKPLSDYAKKKIAKYYKEIAALMNRPYQVYRPKGGKIDKRLSNFAQHDVYLPGLKAAFIPTSGEKLKIVRRGGKIIAKSKYVTISDVELDTEELLLDPVEHVNEQIKNNGAKQFTIQAGRYEIARPYLPQDIAEGVARYCAKYSNETKNNYFGNWLHGLIAYEFDDQASLQEYLHTKSLRIAVDKKERRAIKKLKVKIENLEFKVKHADTPQFVKRLNKRIATLKEHLAQRLNKGEKESS